MVNQFRVYYNKVKLTMNVNNNVILQCSEIIKISAEALDIPLSDLNKCVLFSTTGQKISPICSFSFDNKDKSHYTFVLMISKFNPVISRQTQNYFENLQKATNVNVPINYNKGNIAGHNVLIEEEYEEDELESNYCFVIHGILNGNSYEILIQY